MKGKKIVCIILCMVMCFTLLSGPWRAEAEAAAIAIPLTVLGIVGLFVVSSGYTFSNVGDFRATVTDFCNKNFNMANGAAFMNVLSAISTTSGAVELAAALQSEFFPEFWQAIKDFFGGGEVEVEKLGDPAPSGYFYYGGHLLPSIEYVDKANRNSKEFCCFILYQNSKYYLAYGFSQSHFACYDSANKAFKPSSSVFMKFILSNNKWTEEGSYTSIKVDGGSIIWTNRDILDYSDKVSVIIPASRSSSSYGDSTIATIPVSVDSTYNPDLVYNGWMSKVEAEPWMTYDATSAVFQDITTAETDKTAPMTATQAGVISQGGVKVETETDVVIPEYTGEYAVNGLTSIFPFCIPFDIYDFFSVLVAEREAPKFNFNLNFGKYGGTPIEVDLSGWDSVAKILRTVELMAFCVGLALATSKLIKW